MLFNEPKLLKYSTLTWRFPETVVSVLFNEPKLLKSLVVPKHTDRITRCFSALQRAEIAEMPTLLPALIDKIAVSVLFNEPKLLKSYCAAREARRSLRPVSVLFNEPKLLKFCSLRELPI